jgi:formate dehydrogenase accessory protein FdhE
VDINSSILGKLKEQKQTCGELPQYLELYQDLLLIQVEVSKAIPEPQPILTRDEVEGKLRKGIPVLEWDALSIDWQIYQKLFQKAASTISEHIDPPSESLKNTHFGILALQEMARAWYKDSSLSPWANTHSIAEELLSAVVHCAIKPFLTAQAKAYSKLIDPQLWRRRFCPVCGGKPDFAFLDKEAGARWLLCLRCDTEWLFQRLECPYCGNNNQSGLAYFTDDKKQYRLYICQHCHTYLKAIDLRHAPADTLVPLERVLTVDMDRQGQEKGLKAGYAIREPHYQP